MKEFVENSKELYKNSGTIRILGMSYLFGVEDTLRFLASRVTTLVREDGLTALLDQPADGPVVGAAGIRQINFANLNALEQVTWPPPHTSESCLKFAAKYGLFANRRRCAVDRGNNVVTQIWCSRCVTRRGPLWGKIWKNSTVDLPQTPGRLHRKNVAVGPALSSFV